MVYQYDDTFLIDSIDLDELEKKEQDAIIEINKLGITDEFYAEKLVKSRVYMLLALNQLENEEMREKYRFYEKEFNRYFNIAKNKNAFTNIGNIPINRG